MTERENALVIVKAFKEFINSGSCGTQKNWDYILKLMKDFNISFEEV